MTSVRKPHADDHDLVVDLEPGSHHPTWAYALVKRSYRIVDGELEIAPVEPLRHDIRQPGQSPALPLGSDFWPFKRLTDVVVQGHAHAPGPNSTELEICARVGEVEKRLAVAGRRRIEWTMGGRPYIGPPEPFERMPLDHEHAYGGLDPRVPMKLPSNPLEVLSAVSDHPGMYPRNPFGKGYLVMEGRVDGLELPNLEDPDDRLDDDRLLVREPQHWHRQPLPWALGFWHPLSFPRYAYLGEDAHFPAAVESMTEIARGYFEAEYRTRRRQDDDEGEAFRARFYQEASLGLVLPPLEQGTPLSFDGMTPGGKRVSFAMPAPPEVTIELEGHGERVEARPTAVLVRPEADSVSLVYLARRMKLPRTFLPGVHPTIPLCAKVDDGATAFYEAPPTWKPRAGDRPSSP